MKKMLKIVLALCLFLLLAPGCGAPAPSSSEPVVTQAGETSPAQNTAPRVILAEIFTGDW